MIKSFKDFKTEQIWRGILSKHLPHNIQNIARRKLRMINNATVLTDLRVPPANCLEALKSDRRGQYSIRVNNQWRICFVWQNNHAYDVHRVDYH